MLSCPCILTTQHITKDHLCSHPIPHFFPLLSFLPYKTDNQVIVPLLSFTDDKCQITKQIMLVVEKEHATDPPAGSLLSSC